VKCAHLFVSVAALVMAMPSLSASQAPASPLRIVVIEGEGAVNIIQQKTAVAPVIEVRDRNDQPVAGATVNFVVRSGRAAFSGARTLTVTTNAAGQAAAAGFAPTGSGALQIGATATFQGQAATAVTIAQTNVMTVAEAAAVSSAGAGGAGSGSSGAAAAGGGGAGGGGGLSVTTLGIVGGAVAGGALLAGDKLSGDDGAGGAMTFSGQFSGVMIEVESTTPEFPPYSCTRQDNQTGTLTMTFDSIQSPVQGTMEIQADFQRTQLTCPPDSSDTGTRGQFHLSQGSVTGSRENVTGNGQQQFNFTSTNNPGSGTHTYVFTFTGRVDNDQQISGSLTYDRTVTFRQADNRYGSVSRGTITYQVTLQKR
jgi:hypothetical protein